MNHILRAWLKDNPLTADTSDFVAVPVINASLNVSDIIALLKQEGMEIKEETALDIITRFFRKAEEVILNGNSVNMGFVVARPMIKGVFKDKTWDKEKHSIYVNMTQGAELRKSIAKTKVEILGEQSSPMAIFTLVDTTNNNTSGSLTKGKTAEIKGSYIKIAGEHTDCGIYFTNMDTKAKTKVPAENIALNEPSRLLILVPDSLPAGNYELSITTQSSSGKPLLKQPRTEVFNGTIVIN